MNKHFYTTFTKKKKLYYSLLIATCSTVIILNCGYFLLGYQLLQVDSYSSLYSSDSIRVMGNTLLSRTIIDLTLSKEVTIFQIIATMIRNMHLLDIFSIILILVTNRYYRSKKGSRVLLLLILIESITIIIICNIAFQSMSLKTILVYLHSIGYLLIVFHFIYLSCLGIILYNLNLKFLKHVRINNL